MIDGDFARQIQLVRAYSSVRPMGRMLCSDGLGLSGVSDPVSAVTRAQPSAGEVLFRVEATTYPRGAHRCDIGASVDSVMVDRVMASLRQSEPSAGASVARMEFRVFTTANDREPFDGKAKYEIGPHGTLTVIDDGGRQTVYGPSGWIKIELGPETVPRYETYFEHADF